MMPNQTHNTSNTSFTIQQLEGGFNQLNKEYIDIKDEFQISYKPSINSIFKQIELIIQDQQQYNFYDPYKLRNQNIILFDKINNNKRKMISIFQKYEQAKQYLNTNINTMLNYNLQQLQNQLQSAQLNYESIHQSFEQQKQSIENLCCQYKTDQDYVKIQNKIEDLNEQIQKTTLSIQQANTNILNKNKNLEISNIEKKEIASKIKQFDSEKDEISKILYELNQQKIKDLDGTQNQIMNLQQQIKDLESNIQNSNKPTSVYYLFDKTDMTFLEQNYITYQKQNKTKSHILLYDSGKGYVSKPKFLECLKTITKKFEKIVSETKNNHQILIILVVNSQFEEDYKSCQQTINLLIEKVTFIIQSGYELKIHIFDKQCGDQIWFYHLYTQLSQVANVIYQNLGTFTNQEDFMSNHYQQNDENNRNSQITKLKLNLEKIESNSQEQLKLFDTQISVFQQKLIEKDYNQQQFIQKQKNNQQMKNEQQVFNNQMQLNNLQTTLTSKQNELNIQNKHLANLENMLKTQEQKKYISSYQDQLNKAINECDDLKRQISSLEITQEKQKKLAVALEELIQKLDKLYQGIQKEIFVLFSFVNQFSGEDDLLLLMFALSFDSQTDFIDEDQEQNLQKVFRLDQRNSQIFIEYIQVKVERLQSNQININFIPNHKDEIKIGQLNEIITYVQHQITEKAKQNILRVSILNTKELMIQSLEQNIKRTN